MAEVFCSHINNFGSAFLQTAHVLDAVDSSHSSTLVEGLYSFYKEQKYCDVTIKISEERKIRAHRVVLASFSHYFDSLFGNQFAEASKDEVELFGIDESAMATLMVFAYSGNIRIHAENVLPLLQASNYLGVDFVQKSCAEFLNSRIDSRSCLKIFEIADVFALENLRIAAKRHASRYFTYASKGDGFLNLPLHLLKELLDSEDLCVVVEDLVPNERDEREKVVLQAVLKFVGQDRVECLHELLSLVRLPTQRITSYMREMANQKLLGDFCESAVDIIKCKDKSSDAESGVSARKFVKSVVICGRPLGYGGHVYFMPSRDTADDDTHYVKGMKLWLEQEGDRSTFRGLTVFYSNTKEVFVGRRIGEMCEFHLEENEKIVKADIRMRWRWIGQMTFYTNKKDDKGNAIAYGPYGEDNGGVYSESPAGSYGYLAGVSATHDSACFSLQFAWRTFIFPGEVELRCTSYKVNDHVLCRWDDNFYYPGIVIAIKDRWVQVLFDDDEDEITHSSRDISAIIPDKVPDLTTLKQNCHVISSCESHRYHIGYMNVDTMVGDGNVEVRCDQCLRVDPCFPVDKLRLFPEHAIPHAVGARVFARWTDGSYYRGFITRASNRNVLINYDDWGTIKLSKQNRMAVILDVLPQASEVLLNDHVIGFWTHQSGFYPGHVASIDAVNQMFEVQFDDGGRCIESLDKIRLIPRE